MLHAFTFPSVVYLKSLFIEKFYYRPYEKGAQYPLGPGQFQISCDETADALVTSKSPPQASPYPSFHSSSTMAEEDLQFPSLLPLSLWDPP